MVWYNGWDFNILENSMDIDKEMNNVTNKLKSIVKYDTIGFVYDLKTLVDSIHFFQNKLIPEDDLNGDNTFYHPKKSPKEHQIAYYSLGRGYPKEIYGGHWCYVFKKYKNTSFIIPTSSVKIGASKINKDYEMKIEVDAFENDLETRLRFTHARVVDNQRLDSRKSFYNVLTEKENILEVFNKIVL